MQTLRSFGIVVVVFIISLPVMYVVNNGLPAKGNVPVAAAAEGEEDHDDPVVDALCLKGLMLLGKEQYEKAIAAYSDAIRRDPKYSFAFLGRGDVYLAQGDLDRALLDYKQAVRLDPNNEVAKERVHAVGQLRTAVNKACELPMPGVRIGSVNHGITLGSFPHQGTDLVPAGLLIRLPAVEVIPDPDGSSPRGSLSRILISGLTSPADMTTLAAGAQIGRPLARLHRGSDFWAGCRFWLWACSPVSRVRARPSPVTPRAVCGRL